MIAKNTSNGYVNNSLLNGTTVEPQPNQYISEYIALKANTEYTISGLKSSDSYNSSLVFYDVNYTPIDSIKYQNRGLFNFTTPQNTAYIRISVNLEIEDRVMLNEGSTALPYEPYGNTWNTIGYKKYETATDTITSLPKTIIGDGQPITSYTIKGNIQQSGTPTPSNPIYPSECGERTENLFGYNVTWWRNNINDSTNHTDTSTTRIKSDIQDISDSNSYISLKIFAPITNMRIIGIGFFGDDVTTKLPDSTTITITNTTIIQQIPTGAKHYFILLGDDTGGITSDTKTALASAQICAIYGDVLPNTFIPYGYKIPITLGNNNYSVYLSEPLRKISDTADSLLSSGTASRVIKKLVLTGSEDWNYYGDGDNRIFFIDSVQDYSKINSNISVCSHYPTNNNVNSATLVQYGVCFYYGGTPYRLYIKDTSISDTSTLIQYLAAQYAAGTPVTIWYVLATPITETITPPSLPTSGTAEIFDIDTTLKPSEVSLTYHGWHEHSDTKFTT